MKWNIKHVESLGKIKFAAKFYSVVVMFRDKIAWNVAIIGKIAYRKTFFFQLILDFKKCNHIKV